MAAFRRLLNDVNNNRPTTLQTDKGSEFLNRPLQRLLKEYGVHHFTTHNEETKASVVNRSLKTRMWRYFTKKQTIRYATGFRAFVQRQLSSQHRHGSVGGERRQSGNGVDWHGDSLDGTFYEPELQKVIVSADKTYRVEAELRRRNNGREVLVKWFGYPESFNSWIDARTLTSYT